MCKQITRDIAFEKDADKLYLIFTGCCKQKMLYVIWRRHVKGQTLSRVDVVSMHVFRYGPAGSTLPVVCPYGAICLSYSVQPNVTAFRP